MRGDAADSAWHEVFTVVASHNEDDCVSWLRRIQETSESRNYLRPSLGFREQMSADVLVRLPQSYILLLHQSIVLKSQYPKTKIYFFSL